MSPALTLLGSWSGRGNATPCLFIRICVDEEGMSCSGAVSLKFCGEAGCLTMGGLQSLGRNLYSGLFGDFVGTATVPGDFPGVFTLWLDPLNRGVVGASSS